MIPVIHLNALESFMRYVRPNNIEIQIPLQSWSRLQDGTTAEETICTIGAAPDRSITILPSLTSVSRNHGYISVRYAQNGCWSFWLHDTSRNGTRVNGKEMRGVRELINNDLIALAQNAVVLRFSHFDRPTTTTEHESHR
jgi:pSer/pThr/pTyr-binding forkhead associated (FHA) protein